MKLDFDVVREVLLEIEENTTLHNFIEYTPSECGELKFYAVYQLKEADFLDVEYCVLNIPGVSDQITVKALTWAGHELLNNIRSKQAFESTKRKILKTIGSVSIKLFAEIAHLEASEILKSAFTTLEH